MQDEVNTKVVAIMIKGGKISAEVLKKALDKFVQEIEKAQKQMQQPKTYRGKQSIKHLMSQNAAIHSFCFAISSSGSSIACVLFMLDSFICVLTSGLLIRLERCRLLGNFALARLYDAEFFSVSA